MSDQELIDLINTSLEENEIHKEVKECQDQEADKASK